MFLPRKSLKFSKDELWVRAKFFLRCSSKLAIDWIPCFDSYQCIFKNNELCSVLIARDSTWIIKLSWIKCVICGVFDLSGEDGKKLDKEEEEEEERPRATFAIQSEREQDKRKGEKELLLLLVLRG